MRSLPRLLCALGLLAAAVPAYAHTAGEEGRGRTDEFAVHEGEVEGEVVAFSAEAPGALGVRSAEDRDEVVLGVALGT